MEEVEFLIAGGGGAGFGLACAMLDSPLKESSILIIDRDTKQHNDRTWCFWGGPEIPFASIARHSWQELTVRSEQGERVFDMAAEAAPGWRYWMVSGIDYYRHVLERLAAQPNVRFVQGSVERIEEQGERALVTVNGEKISASWVFDSILRPGDLEIDPNRHHHLKQHFKGWEIETGQPVFTPTRATLFDFTTPQKNDLRFFYVLPFSETRALIEYTIFSPQVLSGEEYDAGLENYIRGTLGIAHYSICSREQGIIPMTDYPFQRRAGRRVLNIGTRGGLVKPSTGYAFKRMQRDARAIVVSLVRNGHPFDLPRSPGRYRFYDSLLLQILYRQGQKMKPVFIRLFGRNPLMRIFRFLDEDASLSEDLALIASLPPGPFLRALLSLKILRKI